MNIYVLIGLLTLMAVIFLFLIYLAIDLLKKRRRRKNTLDDVFAQNLDYFNTYKNLKHIEEPHQWWHIFRIKRYPSHNSSHATGSMGDILENDTTLLDMNRPTPSLTFQRFHNLLTFLPQWMTTKSSAKTDHPNTDGKYMGKSGDKSLLTRNGYYNRGSFYRGQIQYGLHFDIPTLAINMISDLSQNTQRPNPIDLERVGKGNINLISHGIIDSQNAVYSIAFRIKLFRSWDLNNRFFSHTMNTAVMICVEDMRTLAPSTTLKNPQVKQKRNSYKDLDSRQIGTNLTTHSVQTRDNLKPIIPGQENGFVIHKAASSGSIVEEKKDKVYGKIAPTPNFTHFKRQILSRTGSSNIFSPPCVKVPPTNQTMREIMKFVSEQLYTPILDGICIKNYNEDGNDIHIEEIPKNSHDHTTTKVTPSEKYSLDNVYDAHVFVTKMHHRTSKPQFGENVTFNIPILLKKPITEEQLIKLNKDLQSLESQFPNHSSTNTALYKYYLECMDGNLWLSNAIKTALESYRCKICMFSKTKIGGLTENGEIVFKLLDALGSIPPNSQLLFGPINDRGETTPKNSSNTENDIICHDFTKTFDVVLSKKLSSSNKSTGQIDITLRYLPTSGRLQISFNSIRNIVFPFFAHSIQGLYIKVSVCIDQKLMARKKTPIYHIIPHTIAPYQRRTTTDKTDQIGYKALDTTNPKLLETLRDKFDFKNVTSSKPKVNESTPTNNDNMIENKSESGQEKVQHPQQAYKINSDQKLFLPSFHFREYSSSSSDDSSVNNDSENVVKNTAKTVSPPSTASNQKRKKSTHRPSKSESETTTTSIKANNTKHRNSKKDGRKVAGRPTDMLFMLNSDEQKRCTIFVCLVAVDPENPIQLFRKFTVGSVILGPRGNTISREQWETMIHNLREPISKWHDFV